MMITRSSKRKKPKKDSEGRNNFGEIPMDLEIEILRRLPVKSLARFLLVSKLWAKIIRSRDFITSFPFMSSSLQPRLLVAFVDRKVREPQDWYFFTRSTLSSSSTSSLLSVTCPFPNPVDYHPHYVNGLMCLSYGQEQIITNPSTGRSITLPRVKTRRRVAVSFFGYDSVNDQYKVLCMTEKLYGVQNVPSSQHQVITLGSRQSWRMINCSILHRPYSNGLCVDGVIYYLARTGIDLRQLSVMRFDLRSEEIGLLTSLHADIPNLYDNYTLINYEGKVAIPTIPTGYTFSVWVIDKDGEKYEWLKKSFIIDVPWKRDLRIRGTTHMGEFILVPWYNSCDEFNVILYNPGTNSLRNIKFEVKADYNFKRRDGARAIVFPDYVESVRLLERRSRFDTHNLL